MTTLSMTASAVSHMGSIANDSGRNVTVSAIVALNPAPVSPGSHGNGDEYSMAARFTTDSNITNGLTITSATFKLTATSTYNAGANVIAYLVSAHAADNAGVLVTTSGNLNTTARPRTTAVSGVWTQTSVTAATQYTIDVTSVVQELVNRGGWAAGNSIVILVDTDTTTSQGEWQDYDSTGGTAPVLDIVYTAGGGSPQTITAEGLPPRSTFGTQNAFESAAFVPTSDISVGAWTTETGGTTNLYASVDEASANDADYIQSEAAPAASAVQIKLATMTDPAVSYGHYVTYRIQKTGSGQLNMVVRLKQGATTIASWSHTDVSAVITEYTQTLSSAETDSITDYTDLRLEIEGTQV